VPIGDFTCKLCSTVTWVPRRR